MDLVLRDYPPDETGLEKLEAVTSYYAAFFGFPDVIEKLITEQPEHVSSRGGPCGTALHVVSTKNHLDVVQSLLRLGADVNALGGWGRTPLMFASAWAYLKVGRWLLEHGADVNAKEAHSDQTSLHLAAFQVQIEFVRTLLKHNADANARINRGRTPLHVALMDVTVSKLYGYC
jgi:ankyrin repeat protein